MLRWFWLLFLPCCMAATPDPQDIQQWLGRQAGQIETILSQAPVRLLDGEPALLLAAEMSPRGYHERVSYILARPALRQARALRQWDSEYAGLTVFALDGRASGVMVGMDVIAQGISEHRREFVYFDGWRAVSLYAREWSGNDGICEDLRQRCTVEEVSFRILGGSPVVIREHSRRATSPKLDSLRWHVASRDITLSLP